MTLKYKEIKEEFIKIFKGSNIGIRDIVFSNVASIRNYPAIRINLKAHVKDPDNQVIQLDKQVAWVCDYEIITLFKGSESENTTDQAIELSNKVYDVCQAHITSDPWCKLEIEDIVYFTAPSDKGYIYGSNMSVNIHYIENR